MEDFFSTGEREMLVRYCARFTHDWLLAEDLAQQAMLEAWLKADHLYVQEVRTSWLIGIARNLCLRRVLRQRQEQAIMVEGIEGSWGLSSLLEDDWDPEREFERQELVELLKKALALLPEQTRLALVQFYLEAVPQTEIAAHLGITVGAVEARLNRGKRALRHLLTHELREGAASYGPVTPIQTGWQHTHIWCPVCGQQHLLMKLPDPPGTLAFRCPACSANPNEIGWGYPLSNTRFVKRLAGIRQPKTILRRFISWAHDYYLTATSHQGVVACAQCGQERHLQIVLPARFSGGESRYELSGECHVCGWRDFCSPAGLVQGMPDVQRFWQAHPRMRMVFREPIGEVAGTPAWVIRFESITGTDHLDVILAQETLTLIAVHTNAL